MSSNAPATCHSSKTITGLPSASWSVWRQAFLLDLMREVVAVGRAHGVPLQAAEPRRRGHPVGARRWAADH
jgi:hypothetical protein